MTDIELNEMEFEKGILEGISLAQREVDRLGVALDGGNNEYCRPASYEQISNAIRKLYATQYRYVYPKA
jgi:hypothetical protein